MKYSWFTPAQVRLCLNNWYLFHVFSRHNPSKGTLVQLCPHLSGFGCVAQSGVVVLEEVLEDLGKIVTNATEGSSYFMICVGHSEDRTERRSCDDRCYLSIRMGWELTWVENRPGTNSDSAWAGYLPKPSMGWVLT